MALFQKTVLSNHLRYLPKEEVEKAWQVFSAFFHNPQIQKNIEKTREEQYQGEFLIDLFVNVFGYTKQPTQNFNLTTEFKNSTNQKKADGAILKNGNAIAIIELKDTRTLDLRKVEEQAFGYKMNQPNCIYVITSNFEKLRFYIDNTVNFEEFNLFKLTRERFEVLFLCIYYKNILSNLPKRIKDESIIQEEEITRKLYKDYSDFRNDIFENIVKNGVAPHLKKNFSNGSTPSKLDYFKKTQKLLDRFLFILFAEDRLLLPPNSIQTILENWVELKEKHELQIPLYERFKKYFSYIDKGHKGKNYSIFPYNGGLFAHDELLDAVLIDDKILYGYAMKLSRYDYESEVSVTVLGHIFEHSLNELEEMQAILEGKTVNQKTTKRKKDGIFYTPHYITKYILQNSVGKLCEEKKTELEFDKLVELKENATDSNQNLQAIERNLIEYKKWLLQLTICDPACGSGAFLNEALEFLITEHTYIDEIYQKIIGKSLNEDYAQKFDASFDKSTFQYSMEETNELIDKLEKNESKLKTIEEQILENNLFGVDINEESIEIAKLSLWLRTAQRGRKLISLNENIKCGNSLIDNKEIVKEKAFNWNKEFPTIFDTKNGFDTLVGNPPYGGKIPQNQTDYLLEKYSNFGLNSKLSDTYLVFYSSCLTHLVRENGILSFIAPNTWRLVESGRDFRNYILSNFWVYKITSHSEKVFPDATVDVDSVFIKKTIKKDNQEKFIEITIGNIAKSEALKNKQLAGQDLETEIKLYTHSISQNKVLQEPVFNLFLTEKLYQLRDKIAEQSYFVKDFYTIKNGVKPYEKGKGTPPQSKETLETKPFTSTEKIDDTFLPLLGGSQFHRYNLVWDNDYWIKYGEWLAAPRDKAIFEEKEKLVFRQTSDSIIGHYLYNGFIVRNNTHIIVKNANSVLSLKCLLAILNSKLLDFYYFSINPEKGEVLAEVKAYHLGLLPFPKNIQDKEQILAAYTDKMLELHKEFKEKKNRFVRRVEQNFSIKKITKNIESFYEYEFIDFVKELRKQKIILTAFQQDEYEEYFGVYKKQINQLQKEINEVDLKMDRIVFDLYQIDKYEIDEWQISIKK